MTWMAVVAIYVTMAWMTSVVYCLMVEVIGQGSVSKKDLAVVTVFWPIALAVLFGEALGRAR
jgi:hypothetical protein